MSYFVPCSTNFQDAVKNKLSDRSWMVLIDIDDDDILEDVTDYVRNNEISGSGKLEGSFNEAISNSYKITLKNSDGFFSEGDFSFAKCEIRAKVGIGEYITIFTGFVNEEGCSRIITTTSGDFVTLAMFDRSKHIAMQRKTINAVYINHKISDPIIPGSSLFHRLAEMLGLSSGDLDLGGVVDYVKPYLALSGDNRVWTELQSLAVQYLGQLYFRYDGKLRFRSRHETGWVDPSPEWIFSEEAGNIHNIKAKGGKITSNRVSTELETHTVLTQRKVFRNVYGYNIVTGKCSISVLPGEYWPGGTRENDVAELKYVEPDSGEEYSIAINVQTPTIGVYGSGSDIECDGGLLELESFNGVAGTNPGKTNQNPGSSEIILFNNTGFVVTITKMDIYGQPIRVDEKIIVEDIDATITDPWKYRDKNIDGKYGVSNAQATITTQWWVEYGKVKRRVYEIETDWIPQVQEGALVTLISSTYNINMVCEVVGWDHPAAKGTMRKQITKLTLREWISFSPDPEPGGASYQSIGLATAEGIDETAAAIESRPTFTEVQEGYDAGGGVTIPEIPVILICEAVGTRGILLIVNRQLNLTNFYGYEWQVSADDGAGSPAGGWFELEFDGSDWKGSADPAFTSKELELFVHTGIPHEGSIEAPIGRKLHYRCRRVTKAAVKSSWSSTASSRENTVSSGSVAENTIYANSMVSGVLNALIASINSYMEVGGEGFVGKTYGDSNGYQECGLSGRDNTLETGLSPETNYNLRINVDNGGIVQFTFQTGTDTKFLSVLNNLNGAMVGCTWSIVNGDLRCVSASSGLGSSISLSAGDSLDFFAALSGFTSFDTEVDGVASILQWGSTRARVYEDSMVIEFWSGQEWQIFLRIGGQYNGYLYPYFQGRGLTQLGAESDIDVLDFGQIIPAVGAPRVFALDSNYDDQNGDDPWDVKSNLTFSATNRKFGVGCLTGASDSGLLKENTDFLSNMSLYPYVYDFWFRSEKCLELNSNVFGLHESNPGAPILGSNQQIQTITSDGFVCADNLSAEKIVLCYVDSAVDDLYVRIGIHNSDNSISWGSAYLVDNNVSAGVLNGRYISIAALTENRFVLGFIKSPGYDSFSCVVCDVSGTVVSPGGIEEIVSFGGSYISCAKLSSSRFVCGYFYGTNAIKCVIGNISGTNISFGSSYDVVTGVSYPRLIDVQGLTNEKFAVCYENNITNRYPAVKTGIVSNGDEIAYGTETIVGGTNDTRPGLAKISRVSNDCLILCFVPYIATSNIFFTVLTGFGIGVVTFTTPSDSGVLASLSENLSFCLGGFISAGVVKGMVLKLLNGASADIVPVEITLSTGAVSVGNTTIRVNPSYFMDSGPVILSKNRFNYVVFYATTADYSINSRVIVDDRRYYFGVEKVLSWVGGKEKFFFVFNYGDTAHASLTIPFPDNFVNESWYHVSMHFDLSGSYFYITVNEQIIYSRDVTSDSFENINLEVVCDLLDGDKLDDVFVAERNLSLTPANSIDHFKKNIKWSGLLDYEKDIVIVSRERNNILLAGEIIGVDSNDDCVIKCIPGKQIKFNTQQNEESCGTLHLIDESDRPSFWVLAGGTATTFTDIDFSSYVPTGVKALFLSYAIRWVSDGVKDDCVFLLRKKGSAVTDLEQLTRIGFRYLDMPISIASFGPDGVCITACDVDGVIQYSRSSATDTSGLLYLTILGYYI